MLHVCRMRDRAKCMHRSCIIVHRACTIHARWRERCMDGTRTMHGRCSMGTNNMTVLYELIGFCTLLMDKTFL